MSASAPMSAMLLKNDGYARQPSGPVLEAMEPYVQLETIATPAPAEGQVLIRVSRASVNPSDVMFIKGLYGQPRMKGRPAGFEGSGIVTVSGGGALGDAMVGRRVAFATGQSNWGSWADFAIADARSVIPLIDGVSDIDGAALIVNPLTALAMFDLVREEGQKSFVLTAGASQLCKLMMGVAAEEGFRPIAIVRRDDQGEILARAGAAHVLNAGAGDFRSRLRDVLAQEQPRIFLDAVTGPLASTVFHAMGNGARWIVYGRLDPSDTTIREPGQLIFQDKRVEGFWLTEWMRRATLEKRAAGAIEAQQRFASGRWRTDVTAVLSLDEAMARLPAELARPNGKVFLAPAGA
ncbi:MAG: zinc-binding dehydrogenase [Rhizobiaceae bacterium]